MKAVVESMNLETTAAILMETLAMDLRMALVMVLLPLLGPLLWTQQSHLEIWNIIRILDLEVLDFSLIVLDGKVESSLGNPLNSSTHTP